MIKNTEAISSLEFNKGLVTRADFLKGDINASPNTMDVQWRFDASLQKRLGSSSTNTVVLGSNTVASWIIDSNSTLSTSLISYWKLDESANTRADSVDGNPLIQNGTVGSVTGIRGQAALFVAANSQGLFGGNPTNLQTGGNFSVETWFYLNSTNRTVIMPIVSKKDINPDGNTVLLLHNDALPFTDFSIMPKTISTAGNMSLDSTKSVFGGASAKFGGAGDIEATDDVGFYFGTSDLTIEMCAMFSSATGSQSLYFQGNSLFDSFLIQQLFGSAATQIFVNGAGTVSWATNFNTGIFYRLAFVRSSGIWSMYTDGSSIGTNNAVINVPDYVAGPFIGSNANGAGYFNGWMDEYRISKGLARYAGASYNTAGAAFGGQDFEYQLYVNTDNVITFEVSSSGLAQNAQVRATSIGAITTSTWYNVVAWHSNNSHVGLSVNLSVNTVPYTAGVRIGAAPFALGALTNATMQFLDGRIDETAYWNKVLASQERIDLYGGGSGNTFTPGISSFGWGMFDFGASALRWLVVAAGTGLYASSNLGTNFVVIGSTRTQNYQYFERSKNVLIATSDSYDIPLYWAGSAGTSAIALAPNSAPSAKFSINYQGFLALLNYQDSNGTLRKRGFNYVDENLQITSPFTSSFDFPSSGDDEITGAFQLYKFLYVSTRYKLYRVAFVGGNPDWSYLEIKKWGFVPRSIAVGTLQNGGQVALGMDWDRRIRMFDGFDDRIISDNVENSNGLCDFAINNISYAGSGLVISHAVVDPLQQEYRLNVAIGGASSQTTHALVLNLRSLAFYPYQNQQWQAMCVAESNNQRKLMAIDRSGFVYILNSGNLDKGVTPINDVYDTPPLFSEIPENVSKGKELNLFFAPVSCGTVYFQDRVDLSNIWSPVRPLQDKAGNTQITGTESLIKVLRVINTPNMFNTYQGRVTSSSGTAPAWQLDRLDFIKQGFGLGRGNG